jgi:hypothetical protein
MVTIRPELPTQKVILFTGNYGSGKTEVAVNYASWLAGEGLKVTIGDLDLVNPYFRCREASEPLEALGVEVVAPKGDYHSADLPILLPEVKGIIEHPKDVTILDVGGDNVGATVLAALTPSLEASGYDMVFVVNRNRPFTDTAAGCIRIIHEVEKAARLQVTSVAGNTHLMEETTPETVELGMKMTEEVARSLSLPVRFICIEKSMLESMEKLSIPYPILPLERMLLPPWKQKELMTRTTHPRDGFGKLTAEAQFRQRKKT